MKSNVTPPGWAWCREDIYHLQFTETGDATNYASAVEALNAYFMPQVNSAFARQTFHRITQNPGETVQ